MPKGYVTTRMKSFELLPVMRENQFQMHPRTIGQSARESFTDYANPRENLVSVSVGQNIQDAIDKVHILGGGTVFLRNGTHIVNNNLVFYSNIYFEGENAGSTIVNFNSQAYQILIQGTNAYTTGTVTVSNNSQTVTGSGTTFTSGMVGRYILLGGLWYLIGAFGSTTSLTLAAPYGGIGLSAESYVISDYISQVKLLNMTIKNSNLAAVKVQYSKDFFMKDVNIQTSATSVDMDDSSQITFEEIENVANNSGFEFGNTHFIEFTGSGALDCLASHAITLNNVTNSAFLASFFLNSAGDGINMTDCENVTFNGVASIENGGQGAELVSGCNNVLIIGSAIQNNASDGIRLTAQSSNNFITNNSIKDNGGYGVNIVA